MIRKFIVIILVIFGGNNLHAQQITPELLTSSGGYFSNTNNSLTWSLGEIEINTFGNTNNIQTQGFNQSDINFPNGLLELNTKELSIYPNPTNSILTIDYNGSDELQYSLQNTFGQIVYSNDIAISKEVDLSNLTNGTYILVFRNKSNQTIRTIKLNKIN